MGLKPLVDLLWSGTGGQNSPRQRYAGEEVWSGLLPGSGVDFEEAAGKPWLNSTVAACLNWKCDEFPQARLTVTRKRRDGTDDPQWSHPLLAQLKRPNGSWTEAQLWQATLASYDLDGNAYWLKMLSGSGSTVELWPIDPDVIEPLWPQDGSSWISGYIYQPSGTPYFVPIDRVVHFKDRPDPSNPRKGLGRVKAVLREICGDNEAAGYTYALLKNLVIGSIVAADGTNLTADQSKRLAGQLQQAGTGDRRFRMIGTSVPIKAQNFGQTPENLKLDVIPKHLEARICAAIGTSPMVLGLPSAKDFATYANAEQAAKGAWSRIRAQQRNMARTVEAQLLPDFDRSAALSCGWDWSMVPALQADAKEVAGRALSLFRGGVVMRGEAREIVGLDPVGKPELDDVFFDGTGPGAPEPEPAPAIEPPPAIDQAEGEEAGQRSRPPGPFQGEWSY